MGKSEKALSHKTLARELETLVKRYSEIKDDETVSDACNILTQIREPLSLSPAYFLPVVDFFTGSEDRDGLEAFLENRLK